MGKVTGISWCNHTHNFWWGCTHSGPECDHCYAEVVAKRMRNLAWGPGAPRIRMGEKNRMEPYAWDRAAAKAGERRRVFTLSMGDMFDMEVDPKWRDDAWRVIADCKNLDWLVLSKRPALGYRFLRDLWGSNPWPHVWIGATAGTTVGARGRLKDLVRIPAAVRFVSVEPLLQDLDLSPWLPELDWIITGGESGSGARPMDLDWARRNRDQTHEAGATWFMKQVGSNAFSEGRLFRTRHPHGADPAEWPEDLRIQDFPRSPAALSLFAS